MMLVVRSHCVHGSFTAYKLFEAFKINDISDSSLGKKPLERGLLAIGSALRFMRVQRIHSLRWAA